MQIRKTLQHLGQRILSTSRRISALGVASVLVLAGCEGDAAEDTDAASAVDGTSGTEGTDGTDGSTAADGDVSADGTDGTDGATVVKGAPPELSDLKARVSGRAGHDISISVIVKDKEKDVAGVEVRVLDAAGTPIKAFRSGLEPEPDSASTRLPFEGNTVLASFIGKVTMAGVALEFPDIATLEIAVFDLAGNTSAVATVSVTAQELKALGEQCDPNYVDSRCEQGLGCVGNPATCGEGTAPNIDKLAYIVDELGPRILIAGKEPEDDVASVFLEFLDAKGDALEVDFDGDESPDGTTFDIDAAGKARDGLYFVAITPSVAFSEAVPQIAVTVSDGAGHQSERKLVKQSKTSVKGNGAACDPRGFDSCGTSGVCAPNAAGTATNCQPKLTIQVKRCGEYPAVSVGVGSQVVSGIAAGVSTWDAPTGCAAADPVGRPEGLVVLDVVEALSSLTLSTATDGTNFDTVVYVLDACGKADAGILACSDDTSDGALVSAAGMVVLESVNPGKYYVIVDAWSLEGGTFNLAIDAN